MKVKPGDMITIPRETAAGPYTGKIEAIHRPPWWTGIEVFVLVEVPAARFSPAKHVVATPGIDGRWQYVKTVQKPEKR